MMDDYDPIQCLQDCSWKVSEVIQALPRCPHRAQRHEGQGHGLLCRDCLGIQTQLGLISGHLESKSEVDFGPELQRQVWDLLALLRDMCSWQRHSIDHILLEEQRLPSLAALIEDTNQKGALRKSIASYLRSPPFALKPLSEACQKLADALKTDDSEDAIEMAEPEDYSRVHDSLFPALRKHSFCDSCGSHQGTEHAGPWHPTRLFLTSLTEAEDGLVHFDVITSSISYKEPWQDLCIKISASGKRVTFVTDDKATGHVSCVSVQSNLDQLRRFCHVFSDNGCRTSLKLRDGILYRLGFEVLKHRASRGKGVRLADVLEHYALSVREKLALAFAIALAFWQFYNSPLMHKAWSSQTIWFMPEPGLQDSSERMPLRAYIEFRPEATECDFDASEFITGEPLVHRCPRIQSLAILLLEIGLGKAFRCRSFDRPVRQLNSRYSVAAHCLKELESATWNFAHKPVYVAAVEKCLKFSGLMGNEASSSDSDSRFSRRQLLHEQVVSPLEWLNTHFRMASNKMSYLSAKRPDQAAQDTPPQLNGPTRSRNLYDEPVSGKSPAGHTQPEEPIERPTSESNFEVAIVCALTLEADAITALFDRSWDDGKPYYDRRSGDTNSYSTGCIGRHNVVVIHLPGMGKAHAAVAATNCSRTFPNIKLAIVVGVCGTVPLTPKDKEEVVLGDVIVSEGIIQYDFGRRLRDNFVRKDTVKDSLPRPNINIRSLVNMLRGISVRKRLRENMTVYLSHLAKEPELGAEYPGTREDTLFNPTYSHCDDGKTCWKAGCREDQQVIRQRLARGVAPRPAIHFGLIGSGDTVMKSGEERDNISRKHEVLGFEMEGAGVWDVWPCVVIKGACDYADSHKTKAFQRYAAATAASCAKAFLDEWYP